ncbi:17.6 kDa class i heat shock protein 1 [Phtheirospermum japonicum]|uniref:17.6 kDa class i heat shock protein 1 n=1 Tax=Phtheirospermum japonicum TaxID=374723 RepID=A0A830AZ09_9LAMI|nr:17.6 kDa class i heat shock protein 1 [Phtheirospermum japonicum]
MELGLKLTRAADDFTSYFQISKDRAGPLFLSKETDAMYILTAHLKGYERRNIKIDINEDGTLIAISGERQVKETLMVGWKVEKKDTVIKGFKKVFKIPDGVILDKIKATYNYEYESTLTITMPKKVKGIRGTSIEEIEEKHDRELVKEGSSNLQIVDENANNHIAGTSDQEIDKNDVKEIKEDQNDVEPEQDVHEIINSRVRDDENEERNESQPAKRCKMCIPIVAGSTLLLSFIVFVFQMIRSKNQTSRKRD